MINIKPEIKKLLGEVTKNVSFHYPTDWVNLPCISFYESGNREYKRADGEERLSEIVMQIDVWAKMPSQNSDLTMEIDKKMAGIGFVRQFSADLFDGNTHHKTMRYRGIVDREKQNVYQ